MKSMRWNVLYFTGWSDILAGKDAAILPISNLAVRVTIAAAIFVENGLGFRGEAGDSSPYNLSYAALSFEDELNMGYSHMRDDDPTSLNDDYVQTFTVSSYPGRDIPPDQFEIMVRRHGPVTRYLSQVNERACLEIPLKGFGGSFTISTGKSIAPYVAGGIGITPLLVQIPELDIPQL
ncbi:hypothetical protein PCG10_006121 [Penicillium crustosum]|uniref:FAD-binding FR-type domain-containing protein n=1 Tax=Penicillium crustosum TaxID=36656 RepID=A0A9P5L759_PENCR|nr:hypothetical protein PCG10_006121 [Penicillium crustosum]